MLTLSIRDCLSGVSVIRDLFLSCFHAENLERPSSRVDLLKEWDALPFLGQRMPINNCEFCVDLISFPELFDRLFQFGLRGVYFIL